MKQRLVCGADHAGGVWKVGRPHRNAHAHRQGRQIRLRRGNGQPDALGNAQRGILRGLRAKHHEFLSTNAGDKVHAARLLAQHPPHGTQRLVANIVPQPVIDDLEFV